MSEGKYKAVQQNGQHYLTYNGAWLAQLSRTYARLAASALNACRNVPTDQLAGLDVAKLIAERDALRAAQHELLDTCKLLLKTSENIDAFYHNNLLLHAHAMWEQARAAIAKAEALKGQTND